MFVQHFYQTNDIVEILARYTLHVALVFGGVTSHYEYSDYDCNKDNNVCKEEETNMKVDCTISTTPDASI